MASRIPTLPAAVVPVIVGTAAAYAAGKFHFGAFIAAFVVALLIQIGTNFANDLFDFKKGADTAERLGPTRVTQAGLLTAEQVRTGTIVTFALAFIIGLYLVALGGWPILIVGIASIIAGIMYTGGPWPLAYNGLGDVFVFIFFGLVAVMGTYYVHAQEISLNTFLLAIPAGCLATAILVVNNLRDIHTDRLAGKLTLAVRIGITATRLQYVVCLVVPYVIPFVLWQRGDLGSFFWLAWLSFPLAAHLMRLVLQGTEGKALNVVLKQTGIVHLIFGLLFAGSYVL